MTYEESIHKVLLSGSEISSILYALEGWIQANDEYNEGGDLSLDIDNVFTALEEVADSWEGEFADPNKVKALSTNDKNICFIIFFLVCSKIHNFTAITIK